MHPRCMVVVYGYNNENQRQTLGSGVVVPGGDIATACHVVAKAARSVVKHRGKEYDAAITYADHERDVCILHPMPPPLASGPTRVE